MLAEYSALQEHVMRVGGFDEAERVYAAPLDSDSLVLPHGMKVHNVEWVADGAAKFRRDFPGLSVQLDCAKLDAVLSWA